MKSGLIKNIKITKESHELKKPYVLSFVTLHELSSIELVIETEKQTCKAEVVPLYGYSTESEEMILNYLNSKKDILQGKMIAHARAEIEKDIPLTPFATSPLLTSIDLMNWKFNTNPDLQRISFVKPTSTLNPPMLLELIAKAILDRQTVKIKLIGNVEEDIKALEVLKKFKFLPENCIRLDANQAYSVEEASVLYDYISKSSFREAITYVEQPLNSDDWEGHAKLVEEYSVVKTMLDETIITKGHIEKAARIKIPFIKLKLFKQGGIMELLKLAQLAYEKGIKVILGNGVATFLSNKIEINLYTDYPALFFGACEANGFLKLK